LRIGGGVFIAVASQAALRGEPDNSTYCASKWAVRAWAESSDARLWPEGVRVRAICPGRTQSPLLDSALETFAKADGLSRREYEQHCLGLVPARRFGTPEEIAAAIVYMSDGSARPGV